MKVDYTIQNNILILKTAPKKDLNDGLVIQYGDPIPMDASIVHYAAITHEAKRGQTDYELPPDFERLNKIHMVELKNECLDIVGL